VEVEVYSLWLRLRASFVSCAS